MKAYKNILIIVLLASFTACKYEPLTEETAFKTEQQALDQVNLDNGTVYSISDFLDKFMSGRGDLFPVKERAFADSIQTMYIYSVDTIPVNGPGIYIRGRLCIDDKEGNFYKALVLQDLTGTTPGDTVQHCLQIMVDGSSICGVYQIGQEVLIRCNGLAIGKAYAQPQLCVPTYKDYEFETQYPYPGWTAGRIPAIRFNKAITRIGTPDKSKVYYEPINPADYYTWTSTDSLPWKTSTLEKDSIAFMKIMKEGNKMVRIDSCYFSQQYVENNSLKDCTTSGTLTTAHLNVFYSSMKGFGGFSNAYNRVVMVKDNKEQWIGLKVSEYCNFAHYLLPDKYVEEDNIKEGFIGNVRGFLSYYISSALTKNVSAMRYKSCWSVTISSLSDIQMYYGDRKDMPWVPEEYAGK